MQQISPICVAELRVPHISWVAPLPDGRWFVQCGRPGQVLLVDAALRTVWSLDVGTDSAGKHAIAHDASLIALSMRDRVVLLDGSGRQIATFPHDPWGKEGSESGCCAFSSDGQYVWATVPTWPQGRDQATGDELWLIERASRSIVDRQPLHARMAGCEPILHPTTDVVGLSIGEGQDRAVTCWAARQENRISLRTTAFDDRILVDIHPNGTEYLTTPHGKSDGELVRHSFADDQPIARSAAPMLAGIEDMWDSFAGYLTDELVIASTVESEQHLLVDLATLEPRALIAYPEGHAPGWFWAPRNGMWVTVHTERGLRCWSMP